jgi:hypothetical protein
MVAAHVLEPKATRRAAFVSCDTALAIGHRRGLRRTEMAAFIVCARALLGSDTVAAAVLHGASLQIREHNGVELRSLEQHFNSETESHLRTALDEPEYETNVAMGRASSAQQRIAIARACVSAASAAQ